MLLHGLARSSLSMELMQESLEASGFRVANIDYPSRDYPIEELAQIGLLLGLVVSAVDEHIRSHLG